MPIDPIIKKRSSINCHIQNLKSNIIYGQQQNQNY